MKRLVFALVLVGAFLALSGCGAMFQGSSQTVDIQSAPSGAKITATPGMGEYTTPASVKLSRKNSYDVTFAKDGYKPATAHIQASAKFGYIVLDVLMTGLVGVVVDGLTGSWNGLNPQVVTATLEKQEMSSAGPDHIEVKLSATDSGVEIQSDGGPVQVTIEKSK